VAPTAAATASATTKTLCLPLCGAHRSCTPAFLAQLFRIRQQRVMAILALKQLEAQAEAEYVKVGVYFIKNSVLQ
jgi:hypothetical protein